MATKAMKGKDPSTLVWKTAEGLNVKPIYTVDDTAGKEKELPGKVGIADSKRVIS